eukprot:1149936-Pyramimonas_sp.AAC.1
MPGRSVLAQYLTGPRRGPPIYIETDKAPPHLLLLKRTVVAHAAPPTSGTIVNTIRQGWTYVSL